MKKQIFKVDSNRNLKDRVVQGGFVAGLAQITKFIFNIGSTIVLARLLKPEDFGLIAMVGAIIGFVSLFKDMGLSMVTIQRKDIEEGNVSVLFWINVIISIIIMVITISISSAIASFYNEPRLFYINIALATGFLFSGITVQHQSLLQRMMKFSALAKIEIVSTLISIIVGIIFSWYGSRYWALVIMQLTLAMCNAVGVWVACDWRPRKPVIDASIRSMLNFGGNLTGFNILNYFARNLDNVLIGRVWGSQQLGIYSKAYQLLLLPINQVITPITSVAIPTLCSLQNERDRFRRYYCTALNFIAFITFPLVLCMAAYANEIILVILGDQWIGAEKIFKVFALTALFQPLLSTTGWIYISLGQTDRMMKWSLVTVPSCISVFFIGLPWGAYGVAISYTIYYLFMVVPNFMYAVAESPIKFIDLVKSVWRPFIISIFMYLAILSTKNYFFEYNKFFIVVISLIVGLIIFSILIIAWPKAKNEVIELRDAFKIIGLEKFSIIKG